MLPEEPADKRANHVDKFGDVDGEIREKHPHHRRDRFPDVSSGHTDHHYQINPEQRRQDGIDDAVGLAVFLRRIFPDVAPDIPVDKKRKQEKDYQTYYRYSHTFRACV